MNFYNQNTRYRDETFSSEVSGDLTTIVNTNLVQYNAGFLKSTLEFSSNLYKDSHESEIVEFDFEEDASVNLASFVLPEEPSKEKLNYIDFEDSQISCNWCFTEDPEAASDCILS